MILSLAAASAFSQIEGVVPIAAPRARMIGATLPTRRCAEGWRLRREGGCWTTASFPGEEHVLSYVHPGGWIVDPRCLDDRRFDPGEFIAALDSAYKKMSPVLTAEHGGCLATFNPVMAREVTNAVWERPTYLACPAYDPKESFCADADTASYDKITMLRVRNVQGCMGKGTTGLAGTLFHESLHAAKIDNWPVERHNDVQNTPQYKFIYDRVYGTEATCFFGTDPRTRKDANLVQCLTTIAYENPNADRKLCDGFGTYFGDTPQMAK